MNSSAVASTSMPNTVHSRLMVHASSLKFYMNTFWKYVMLRDESISNLMNTMHDE